MSILNQEIKTRITYCLPVWLKEKLIAEADKRGPDTGVSDLITEDILERHPQWKAQPGQVLSHFIGPKP